MSTNLPLPALARAAALLALLACAWVPPARAAQTADAGPAPRIAQRIDETRRVELPGHVHPALAQSVDLGPADDRLKLERLVLVLRSSPKQQADLQRLLEHQQVPGDPDYRHWLRPQEFARRFGVAKADLAKLQAWLSAHGMRVEEVPAGARSIVFNGDVANFERAFGVRLHRYRWRGEAHLAVPRNPSVPAALAGVVAGFASLHDFRHKPQMLRASSQPDFTIGSTDYLAPADFAVIYDVAIPYADGYNGSGRSIAVLGRSSVVSTDLSNFRSEFGISASAPQIIDNGTAPGLVSGDETESDLDLEWSGGLAPGATIKFVTSASTATADGIDLSASYAVSNNVADVISLSYAGCETASDLSGGTPYYQQLWQQAAAQGISVFVAAGDSGAAGCDAASSSSATHGLAVNALCSSPNSTCVGGTQFIADVSAQSTYWSSSQSSSLAAGTPTALSYIGEGAWNQSGTVSGGSDLWASGGGASRYYAKPPWQYALGVPSDGKRDVPDLAFSSSSAHDAYLAYTSDGYSSSTLIAIGGTSASTPSMAAMAALLAQKEGGRVGNVNPVLYGLSGLQANGGAAVFHRITSGNNSVPGQSGFSASTADPEYSQVSGLGSLDVAVLLAHWTDYTPSTAELSPSSLTVPAGEYSATATLTVGSTTAWTASVPASASGWLSISPTSGTGSDVFSLLVLANTSTAARSATVTIGGQPLVVTQAAASGSSGNAAALALSASSFAFSNTSVGSVSATQRLMVANSGNATLTLSAVTLTGTNPGDYTASGSCAASLALAAGASCYVDLAFAPTALGSRAATLQIASNAAGSPASVGLAGTGTVATSDVPLPPWSIGLLLGCLALALGGARPHWRPAGTRR